MLVLALIAKAKAKARSTKRKANKGSNDDEAANVCCEPFGNSRSGEELVQCIILYVPAKRAHFYNCDSDDA